MGISPLHSIHQYSEEIYKVVAFKGIRDPENPRVRDREHEQHYDAKLNEAFCRAKSLVLQYALCNPWDWFFTGTLDETKFNRYNLDGYQQKLSQFIRDKRKACRPIRFLPCLLPSMASVTAFTARTAL